MDMQIPWTKVWAVVITGLVVVFLALVLLIIFVSLFGKVFSSIDKNKNSKQNKQETPIQAKPEVHIEIPKPAASDDDGNIIAAISAAVAMMAEADGKKYAIKSVKRAVGRGRQAGSVWGAAGQRENTRPF